MSKVLRCDYSSFNKDAAEVTREGFLRADVYATRVGIFTYILGDGTKRRELRSESEVFHPDSIRSLGLIPITNDHPPVEVNSENSKKYSVGATSEIVKREDPFLSTRALISDKATVDAVLSGDKEQLSCGYYCDVVMSKGTWNGEEYDAEQKNIRYNHLAVVSRGRAGPEVRIRMDAEDGFTEDSLQGAKKEPSQKKENQLPFKEVEGTIQKDSLKEKSVMAKINIDGVEFELADGLAVSVNAKLAKLDSAEKTILEKNTEIQKLQGKCDGFEVQIQKQSADLEQVKKDSVLSNAALCALGKARLQLEEVGKKVLGDTKFDAMDDLEIKKSIVTKLAPTIKIDGKDSAYVEGIYDSMSIKSDASEAFKGALGVALNSFTEAKNDADIALEKAILGQRERAENGWKNLK